MNEDLAEHIKKLHLEEDDIIIVDDTSLLEPLMSMEGDLKNWIICAPNGDITKCKIEDLRTVVEAYDRDRENHQ